MNVIKKIQERLFRNNLRKRNKIILKDTKELYSTKKGVYKADRQKLHLHIINSLLKSGEKANKNQLPQAFFFGGGSGSGKTTLKEQILKDNFLLKHAVNVDPDQIKLYLPEFDLYKQIDPEQAAPLVHRESCDIRDQLVEHLRKAKTNFVYESTMAKPQKYKQLFIRLRQEGFNIHLYIADIPVSLAKQRVAKRAEQDGKFVPVKVVENTHQLISITFAHVRDLTDNYYIYDNQQGMKLVSFRTIKDRGLYQAFIEKKD